MIYPHSLNDNFIIIKNPKTKEDAIWIQVIWDYDTEEEIIWNSTLLPKFRKKVYPLIEAAISMSQNKKMFYELIEKVKIEILAFDEIESQFIPSKYIDKQGRVNINKYMIEFEWNWDLEDFITPIKSLKPYHWLTKEHASYNTFFKGNFNPNQLTKLSRDEYTSQLVTPELIESFINKNYDDLSRYYKYQSKNGSYFFLHNSILDTVFFNEN